MPHSARQRNTFGTAFRWRADSSPTLMMAENGIIQVTWLANRTYWSTFNNSAENEQKKTNILLFVHCI